jgi:ABC-type sugar transport system ATPase subunit
MSVMAERIPIVRLQGITKKFAGTTAVKSVDFDIYPGTVHGLVGENGAGKSTLMRVLAGLLPDYEGQIFINGRLEHMTSPKSAISLGIALVYQELNLVPELSVAENIFLGREFRSWVPGFINPNTAEEQAKQILSEVEVEISPKAKISNLSIAKQQLVEISKGISMDSKVLILDEPTSSLTAPEIKDLFKIIQNLRDRGTAVVYISHKLAEVFEIADQITVLRDGVKLETRPTAEWDETSLVKAMVGRELSKFFINDHHYDPVDVAMEVSHLTRRPHFEDISFKVYKGEILGIYGLIGAGRTELAETIVGLKSKDSGEVRIDDRLVEIHSPQDSIAHEIALVPEDRRTLGLLANMDVKSNLSLPILNKLTRFGFVNHEKEMAVVENSIQSFEISVPSIKSLVTTLSGGNQQKIVLGKWLNADPKVLILDDPTRGIDVGTKAEIRKIIDRLAGEGRGIILISSELPEILGMSDRVLVMRLGRIAGEFSREQCRDDLLGACAAGVKLVTSTQPNSNAQISQ